jgi:hypothetical protein
MSTADVDAMNGVDVDVMNDGVVEGTAVGPGAGRPFQKERMVLVLTAFS